MSGTAETGNENPPTRLWVQLTANGGTVSYVIDPREVHDNGKPVYDYLLAEEFAVLRLSLEAAKLETRRVTNQIREFESKYRAAADFAPPNDQTALRLRERADALREIIENLSTLNES